MFRILEIFYSKNDGFIFFLEQCVSYGISIYLYSITALYLQMNKADTGSGH